MEQLKLLIAKPKSEFGGSLLRGRRKSERPLSSKWVIHLVLKADNPHALLANSKAVKETLETYGRRFGLKTYGIVVHCDHVHLSIRIPSRALYVRWIRSVASVLVRRIRGFKWRFRPYTRTVSWGRAYKRLMAYLEFNQGEVNFILSAHKAAESGCEAIRRRVSAPHD